MLGVWACESVAEEFTVDSHEVLYFSEGVVYLKYNLPFVANACNQVPIPTICTSVQIAKARQIENPTPTTHPIASDVFILLNSNDKIYMPDCDLTLASCKARVYSILGISSTPKPNLFRKLVGDFDGDSNRDYLLLPTLALDVDGLMVLSTPGIKGLSLPLPVVISRGATAEQVVGQTTVGTKVATVPLARSVPVVSQRLTADILGGSPSTIKEARIERVNSGILDDLVYRFYGSNEKRVAYAGFLGRFASNSVYDKVVLKIPTEFHECDINISHPNVLEKASILFDEACSTAYVSPPGLGKASISNIQKSTSLAFCPALDTASQNSSNIAQTLQQLGQQLLNMASLIKFNNPTTALDKQLQQAVINSNNILLVYKSELQAMALLEDELSFAEFDYEDCVLFSMSTCEVEEAAVVDIQNQIAAQNIVVDTALANHMIAKSVEETIKLQIANYYTNILNNNGEYQQLLLELQALQLLKDDLYTELASLEGAITRLDYELPITQRLRDYYLANTGKNIEWELLPVSNVDLLTNVVNGGSGSPVLWMHGQNKNFDFSMFPRGDKNITLAPIYSGTINLLEHSYVDLGLSLVSACQLFPNGNNPVTSINYHDIVALSPVNLEYTYLTTDRQSYVVSYNLYNLAVEIFSQSLYQKVIDLISVPITDPNFNALEELFHISNEDLAEIIEAKWDQRWFSIKFPAVTQEYSYSLVEQEEIRMDVKATLVRKVLHQVAVAFRSDKYYEHSKYNYRPDYSPTIPNNY